MYGPALLPPWDSQDSVLVTMALLLAPHSLLEQLPMLLPDSTKKKYFWIGKTEKNSRSFYTKQLARPKADNFTQLICLYFVCDHSLFRKLFQASY